MILAQEVVEIVSTESFGSICTQIATTLAVVSLQMLTLWLGVKLCFWILRRAEDTFMEGKD